MFQNFREYIFKTVQDTMEFMRVPVKILKMKRNQQKDPKVIEGMNIAIDYLEEFMARGESVAQLVIDRKYEQLEKMMSDELIDMNIDPSGKDSN